MTRVATVVTTIILTGILAAGLRMLGDGPRVAADGPVQLPDVRVSLPGDLDPHDEPSVAVSPTDNRIMVAASKVIVGGATDPIRSISRVIYYRSSDAGSTWTSGALLPLDTPQTTYQLASDPTVAADTEGNFYLTVLMGSGPSSGRFDNGIYLFKSSDGGQTFGQPIPVIFDVNNLTAPNLFDKPYTVIDTSPTSPFKNTIYVSWVGVYSADAQAIRFAYKRPADAQFSNQQQISHHGTIDGPALAVGPNGEVYGAWEGHGAPDTLLFNASTDGGVTFFNAIGTAQGADLVIHDYVSCLDDSVPQVMVPGVPRINSFPTIDVDRTNGPNRGKLYIAWADPFTTSSTTSDVMLLVLDPPNGTRPFVLPSPTRVKPTGSDQFFPILRIDQQTGIMYIAFYGQAGGGINPFLVSSTDGGASFSAPSSLSSSASDPQIQSQIISANGKGIGIGDYIWLDITKTKLGAVWTDTRNGKQEIFFGGLSFGPSDGGGPTPPPNDNCSTPHAITSLPFSDSLDTRLATTSPSDPVNCSGNQGSNSVWYSLSAASNTVIGIDTSTANYDTTLAVYGGACGSLPQIACNDDFGNNLGNKSMLTFQATAGALYLIEVTGKSTGGNLGLRAGYPTVTSIQYDIGPDGNQSLEISGAGFISNNAQVIVQVDGVDTVLPNTFFTGQVQGDGTVTTLAANRRKLKKLVRPGVPVQVRVESPVGSGIMSVPLSFTR
jgi:hypothetical protein